MTSAVLPSRNEARWGQHKVYRRKFTNLSKTHKPKTNPTVSLVSDLTPNNNPSVKHPSIQNPSDKNPNPSSNSRDSTSSRSHVLQSDEPSPRGFDPPAASDVIKKESLEGGLVTFHLGAYSKQELEDLKIHLTSDLDRVRLFQCQIESQELELRNSSIDAMAAATSAPPANVKRKSGGTARGGNNKILGQKRTMPVSSGRETKCPAKDALLNSAAIQKVQAAMMRKCGQILKKLMNHKFGWVFNKPVDMSASLRPDYHEFMKYYNGIIKHPMDLGTVKDRLDKHVYGGPLDFAFDVRLTFENALTYNPKGDETHILATNFLWRFEELFQPAFQKFEADYQRIIVAQQNSSKLLPDIMQQSQATMYHPNVMKPLPELMHSQVAFSNQKKLPEPTAKASKERKMNCEEKQPELSLRNLPEESMEEEKRVINFEEREKLGSNVLNLCDGRIEEALLIVENRNSAWVAPCGDGLVELDIHALDNETLLELDKFVSLHRTSDANKMRNDELQSPVVVPVIQEEAAAAEEKQRADEDVDIGDEMPMNTFPPLEIEKDAAAPSPGRSSSSSSSSSGSDSSSSSDSDSGSSSSDGDSDGHSVQSPAGLRESGPVTGS